MYSKKRSTGEKTEVHLGLGHNDGKCQMNCTEFSHWFLLLTGHLPWNFSIADQPPATAPHGIISSYWPGCCRACTGSQSSSWQFKVILTSHHPAADRGQLHLGSQPVAADLQWLTEPYAIHLMRQLHFRCHWLAANLWQQLTDAFIGSQGCLAQLAGWGPLLVDTSPIELKVMWIFRCVQWCQ